MIASAGVWKFRKINNRLVNVYLILKSWMRGKYLWNEILLKIFQVDTVWKVALFGVILVCIFPHLDWIRRYWNTDTFYAVNCIFCKLCYTMSWIAWGLLSTRNSLKVITTLLDTNDIIENDKNYHENFGIPSNWCNLVIYFRRKPSGFLWLALLTMIIKKKTWKNYIFLVLCYAFPFGKLNNLKVNKRWITSVLITYRPWSNR